MKRRFLFLLPLPLALISGCAAHNTATLVKALGKDPAGFTINVDTLYGKFHITRANPGKDTPPYTLTADGNVSVGGATSPPLFLLQSTPSVLRLSPTEVK